LALAKGIVVKDETVKSSQKLKETIIEKKMSDANYEQLDDTLLR